MILVTGGAGFIGSQICNELLSLGHKVRVIDNLTTGNINNIIFFMKNKNFEFVYGDICYIEDVERACKDVTHICHQAALISVQESMINPELYNDVNVGGFINVLNVAKSNNIKRIVYASSSAVYGDNKDNLKTENSIGNIKSPYAISKYTNELYANMYNSEYNMECIGLRYFNVYGPTQNANTGYSAVIPKFIHQINKGITPTIYGNGSYSRDFVNIQDVVRANILALFTQNKECYGQVFNIGTSKSYTIIDIYDKISDELKYTKRPIFVDAIKCDVHHSCANISKANFYLNYFPMVSFDDGIKITCEYYS